MRFPKLITSVVLFSNGMVASYAPRHGVSFSATRAFASASSGRTALDELNNGEFKRRDAAWRSWIQDEEGARFAPEKDRYHLYVSMACPWAHRTLITRALKGLEDVISVSIVHPVWQETKPGVDTHRGWIFGVPNGQPLKNTKGLGGPFPAAFPGNDPDELNGAKSIRDLYEKAGDTDAKYSVPVLWDKKVGTIVSNESSEIIRMLNSEFNDFSRYPDVDLYPENMRGAIETVNDWIYPNLNNGVYRCGFATTQAAYDKAISDLMEAFDKVDAILQKQRYIAGDKMTLADIRLFVTLLRFDEVYQVYFKTNTRSVTHSPAILNYCRDIYQMPGVAATVDMEQIKYHYYCSHVELNTYSIVPQGNNFMELLKQTHNRSEM